MKAGTGIAKTAAIGLNAADAVMGGATSMGSGSVTPAKVPPKKRKAVKPSFVTKGARDTSDREGPAEDRREKKKGAADKGAY